MAPSDQGHKAQLELVRKSKFVIGVETEAPLAVYNKHGVLLENSAALAKLARTFNKKGLPAYASALDEEHDHTRWAITIDTSIEVGGNLTGIGSPIEIKSPAIKISRENREALFRKMWQLIEHRGVPSIEYWKMANNHIHFSLEQHQSFPLAWAQKLAFCVIYFERAIDHLIPAMTHQTDTVRPGGWKHCDRYTKRNRVRPESVDYPVDDLASCWAWIRSMQSIQQLSNLICYDEDNWRRRNNQQHKYWKWNFKGLNYTTIEFRHMPPTRNAGESLDWIDFLKSFVKAAGRVDAAKLDDAADAKTSFREALDLSLYYDQEQVKAMEHSWAADNYNPALTLDGYNAGLTLNDLSQFMGKSVDEKFWGRLVGLRDQLEAELAALPP
ncbi:hypothetical protein F4861DRAFT_536538 [Xylaria intraflava]|nr:hypothetical protein F4861DRAFT_536538 [Xylaria intraflava]